MTDMDIVSSLVFAVLFLCIICTPADSISCFKCTGVSHVSECTSRAACHTGEICFHDKIQGTHANTFTHNLGCRTKQHCHLRSQSTIGRRQAANGTTWLIGNCTACCDTASCNKELCMEVDDELTAWSMWSVCDVTCGQGTQSRTRTCTHTAAENGGSDCTGSRIETRTCSTPNCPVDGHWSGWTSWGRCSVTCGPGLKKRHRSCTHPSPKFNGNQCSGDAHDFQICTPRACADGGWSSWGRWSSCSASCGNGIKTRSRDCSNPEPSAYGKPCRGQSYAISSCNNKRCPDIMSSFSVDHPRAIVSGHLSFSHVIYNLGNDFNPSTGVFTCSKPGVYEFSFILVRKKVGSSLVCYLRRNSATITKGQFSPFGIYDDDYAYAVNKAMVHLNKGDVVTLYGCSSPSAHMESWTSFTGFLLYPDV